MVVLGSFIIHIIADGLAYSFGVMMVTLIDQFDATRAQMGWIASIMVGLTMGVGKLILVLINFRLFCLNIESKSII